jgi:hypothetical protein
MKQTRAKFMCVKVSHTVNGMSVEMTPVVGGSEENISFFEYTPYGKLEMGIVNPNVVFEVGKQYYLDFTKAE